MYIMEVLRRADKLYPNEYTLDEKISWIDELNAKISQEYNKKYSEVTLWPDRRGRILLPEGVSYEHVHAIRQGHREIKKENFTTYGVKFLYGLHNVTIIPERFCRRHEPVTVIYLQPPQHIRVVIADNENGNIRADENNGDGFYIDNVIFYEGDILNVKIYGDEDKTEILIDEDICVMGTRLPEKDTPEFFIECTAQDGGDISNITEKIHNGCPTVIMRLITEKTICDTPYDDMFLQWVCAKICFWQKAFSAYNQHMTAYNQILSDYWRWVMDRSPSDNRTQWKRWL